MKGSHLFYCASALLLLLFSSSMLYAQPTSPRLYNPQADARAEIDSALTIAKAENKHLLLQIGGNWCSWCIRFHDFVKNDAGLDSIASRHYVRLHVNFSRENQNLPLMAELGYPQRFGFPVLVVLDASGKRLHTQNSFYLEEGEGYNKRKVKEFFLHWSPPALNPLNYER